MEPLLGEKPYLRRPGEAEDDGSRWGIDGGFPFNYCAVFDLAVDGREIHLVRKLYEDLSHLSRITVGEAGGAVQIEVRGGDAAGSFRAVFRVRPEEVVREVTHGEVPDSIWERLVVHNEEGEVSSE